MILSTDNFFKWNYRNDINEKPSFEVQTRNFFPVTDNFFVNRENFTIEAKNDVYQKQIINNVVLNVFTGFVPIFSVGKGDVERCHEAGVDQDHAYEGIPFFFCRAIMNYNIFLTA